MSFFFISGVCHGAMRNLNNKRNNIGVNDVMIDKKLWNGFILSEVPLYCIYLKLIPRFSYGVDHKIKHFAYERFEVSGIYHQWNMDHNIWLIRKFHP